MVSAWGNYYYYYYYYPSSSFSPTVSLQSIEKIDTQAMATHGSAMAYTTNKLAKNEIEG